MSRGNQNHSPEFERVSDNWGVATRLRRRSARRRLFAKFSSRRIEHVYAAVFVDGFEHTVFEQELAEVDLLHVGFLVNIERLLENLFTPKLTSTFHVMGGDFDFAARFRTREFLTVDPSTHLNVFDFSGSSAFSGG